MTPATTRAEPVAQRRFPAAGAYTVKLCADGVSAARGTQTITVRNRPPTASFTVVPADPVAREQVSLHLDRR